VYRWNEDGMAGICDERQTFCGRELYVTISRRSLPMKNDFLSQITISPRYLGVDTDINKVIAQVKVAPNPHWVAFSPDGISAYTANHESTLVSVIDVPTLTVLGTIPVGMSPHSIAVHLSLALATNVNYDAGTVSVIDTWNSLADPREVNLAPWCGRPCRRGPATPWAINRRGDEGLRWTANDQRRR
jgi:YVTN family beta-propeller protein